MSRRLPPGFREVSPGVFEGPLSKVGPGVYQGLTRIYIGIPEHDRRGYHSCDERGCGSLDHVIDREEVSVHTPFGGLELWEAEDG